MDIGDPEAVRGLQVEGLADPSFIVLVAGDVINDWIASVARTADRCVGLGSNVQEFPSV